MPRAYTQIILINFCQSGWDSKYEQSRLNVCLLVFFYLYAGLHLVYYFLYYTPSLLTELHVGLPIWLVFKSTTPISNIFIPLLSIITFKVEQPYIQRSKL